MAGFCEHGKEILGTVHRGFLHWLKNCQLFKKDPAPRSSPINCSEMNLHALPVCVSPFFTWASFSPYLAGGISKPQTMSSQ